MSHGHPTDRLDRPVFFVGVPRSGTTIVFEAFAAHPDLAWFSNYLYRFPQYPIVSLISRVANSNKRVGAKRQNGESRFRIPWPYAVECYPVWELYCGEKFRFDYLIDHVAMEDEKIKLAKLVAAVMKYQGKPRFATKITGPTRMTYLDSIFPDALFIHVVRDGRAVANSLLNVGFWKKGGGYHKPWWRGGLTEEDMETHRRYSESPLALAAVQWRRILLVAREEAKRIGPGRYFEIRYEDVLRAPIPAIDRIVEFCGLKPSAKVRDYIERKSLFKDMNHKVLKDLKASDVRALDQLLGDVNATLDARSVATA